MSWNIRWIDGRWTLIWIEVNDRIWFFDILLCVILDWIFWRIFNILSNKYWWWLFTHMPKILKVFGYMEIMEMFESSTLRYEHYLNWKKYFSVSAMLQETYILEADQVKIHVDSKLDIGTLKWKYCALITRQMSWNFLLRFNTFFLDQTSLLKFFSLIFCWNEPFLENKWWINFIVTIFFRLRNRVLLEIYPNILSVETKCNLKYFDVIQTSKSLNKYYLFHTVSLQKFDIWTKILPNEKLNLIENIIHIILLLLRIQISSQLFPYFSVIWETSPY